MIRSFPALVLATTIGLIGCGTGSAVEDVRSRFESIDHSELEALADELWDSRSDTASLTMLPAAEWNESLKTLHPKSVHITDQGLYITTWSRFVESVGVFVLPQGSTFNPSTSGDPQYDNIDGRCFIFVVRG